MEIILKEDVSNLGYKGDILKVKDGYGRNFLIPTKKAILATESAKKMLAEDLKQRAHKLDRIKNEAVELADKLKEDVSNLGYKGDILKVKNGYGRNFLIPTKKAILATESAKKMLAEDLKQRAHKLDRIKNEAFELADKLKDLVLNVGAKTSTTGKIFSQHLFSRFC